MRPLFIFGTGGHAAEVLDLVDAINAVRPHWRVAGFLVDADLQAADEYLGYPVLGDLQYWQTHPDAALVIGVGNSQLRQRIVESARQLLPAPCFPGLVHPSAQVSARAKLGEGVQIAAQVVIQARASLADHVIVNIASSISHDCRVGEFATLAPGVRLAGNVTVAEHADLGVGALVIPGVQLGTASIVGAGSVVIRNVPAACTVAGNPAALIRKGG